MTFGNMAIGKLSRLYREMETKAISLVKGRPENTTNTAKDERDTRKGIEVQVKFCTAESTPIFLSMFSSRSFRIKLTCLTERKQK